MIKKVVELTKTKSVFQYDKTKDNFKLIEDVGFIPPLTSPRNIESIPFLNDEESYITGDEMDERAKELEANLGQQHAEYLLEHQSDIPEKFRNYYLVFPGTKWRNPGGRRGVPCLDWDDGTRLVRPRE